MVKKEPGTYRELLPYLEDAISHNCTFLHLVRRADQAEMIRRDADGTLQEVATINLASFLALQKELITQSRSMQSDSERYLELRLSNGNCASCILNIFENIDSICISLDFRRKNFKTLTIEQLGLDNSSRQQLESWIQVHQGLIIIAGSISSGKSSTTDALLQFAAENKDKLVYRIDRPLGYTIPNVHWIAVNMHDPFEVKQTLWRIAGADVDIIGVANPDDASNLPSPIARAAIDAARSGALVVLDVVAQSLVDALRQLNEGTNEEVWEDCVGVLVQKVDFGPGNSKIMSYQLTQGPNFML